MDSWYSHDIICIVCATTIELLARRNSIKMNGVHLIDYKNFRAGPVVLLCIKQMAQSSAFESAVAFVMSVVGIRNTYLISIFH